MKAFRVLLVLAAVNFMSVPVNAQAGSVKIVSLNGKYFDGKTGTNIVLTIELGNPEPVSSLVGLSGSLEWNSAAYIQPAGISKGNFFGNDQLFIHKYYPQKIEFGLSGTAGGHSGTGAALVCTLQVKQNVTGVIPVEFILTHISAINSTGADVTLIPQNTPFLINLCESMPLSLTSPHGGEYLETGSKHNITWSSSGINSIKLDYSTDNGNSWEIIADNISAASAGYEWIVPNTPSEECRVKISNVSDPELNSVSPVTFTIYSVEQMFGPYYPDPHTLALYHFDSNYKNEINLTENAVPYNSVSFNQNPELGLDAGLRIDNAGSFFSCVELPHENSLSMTGDWTIELWFKILSWGSGTVANPFLLCKHGANYFIILRPGDKSLEAGYDYQGGTEKVLLTANSLTLNTWYHFVFIKNSADKTLKGYLHDASRNILTSAKINFNPSHVPKTNTNPINIGGIYGGSNIQFDGYVDEIRISNIAREFRKLNLTSPAGSEDLVSGTKHNITWSCRSIELLKIEYSTNNGSTWNTVINSVNALAGSYSWNVPAVNSDQCLIRISDQSDPGFYSSGSQAFSIRQLPSVTLTKPNGGENWQSLTDQTITWSIINVNLVKIEYTTDNGNSWHIIADSISALPSNYIWKIPSTPSSWCKVKISDCSDSSVSDLSSAPFTIFLPGSVQVIKPNGGERLFYGTQFEITWHAQGFTNARLKYSTNNGSTWNLIATVGAAAEKYTWIIPNIFSENCRVQISNPSDASVADMSDTTFVISPVPSLTLNRPNGGEKFAAGSSELITWSSGFIDNVKIEYCANGGTDWKIIHEAFPADSGKISWLVPDVSSVNCVIRISDASDSSFFDISNGKFTIDVLSGINDLNSAIPEIFELYQNYPNPFNPSTHIRYAVPKTAFVKLCVYDLLGNEIQVLTNEIKNAGYYELDLNAAHWGTGIYFLKMETEKFISIKKLVLMK